MRTMRGIRAMRGTHTFIGGVKVSNKIGGGRERRVKGVECIINAITLSLAYVSRCV
jgi:hypothetical protein